MYADYLPMYTDRKGVNKMRATVDDLIGMYSLFDVKIIFFYRNMFFLDPKRVPTRSPANSESVRTVSALTSLVHKLKDQVAALSEKLKAVCGGRPTPHLPRTGATAAGDGNAYVTDGLQGTVTKSLSESRNSFADKADLLKGAIDPLKPQPPPAPSMGKRKSNDKVKAILRYLVCFVGRLHIDTTDDNLRNYLAEAGIEDAACRKFWTTRTASSVSLHSGLLAVRNIVMYFMTSLPGHRVQNYETGYSAVAIKLQANNSRGPAGSVNIVTYNAHCINSGKSYLMQRAIG